MKINTNPIRIVLKANINSQSVSACCHVVVTDLSAAKHRGNNQARSLEVSPVSFNPSETSGAAPEEMNNHSARFQRSHRGCVSRSHTTSLPVYYMSNSGHSRNKKERKKKRKEKCQDLGSAVQRWTRSPGQRKVGICHSSQDEGLEMPAELLG